MPVLGTIASVPVKTNGAIVAFMLTMLPLSEGSAAGAIVTPDTLTRARALGLDPRAVLAAHDSYGLFDAVGDLVRTGPTLTNVNDLRAVLVAPL